MSIRLLYFSTPDCVVCRSLLPKIKDLVSHYTNVEFRYVDCSKEKQECGQNQVFAVPTLVLFSDNREIKRFSRFFSVAEVQDWIVKVSSEQ